MSFAVGDILFFDKYQFTDTGETRRHFGLVLLPEYATKYQNSVLCCVITSKQPREWYLCLKCAIYDCFDGDSFVCFNRKDLVAKDGLSHDKQPRGALSVADLKESFKILRKSLFALTDIASNAFFRGVIIYQWKKKLGIIA